MNATEYLKTVAETIATYGHRGSVDLQEAALTANQAVASAFSEMCMCSHANHVLAKVRQFTTAYNPASSAMTDAECAAFDRLVIPPFHTELLTGDPHRGRSLIIES